MSDQQARKVNIAEPEFAYDDEDPDGFRSGLFRPGRTLGAKQTGMSVYELPPGQAICPYHYEYAEEEWLLVLEGHPTLRHPGGSRAARAVGRRVLPARARRAPTACATRPTRPSGC